MRVPFLHGWTSVPGGLKPTFLKEHGHEVINPALDDDNFDAALRTAQAEFDRHKPDVIVGSSRGGTVAMNIDSKDTPLLLLCPAWKKWGTATSIKPNTIILHSRQDDVVPFADSDELLANSGLPLETLVEVGDDHRLANEEPLEAMLEGVCEVGGRSEPMNELLSSDLWPRIRQLAKRAKKKSAAIAYVTDDRDVKFGNGDVLITDASDEAIKSGQTSAAVLKSALKRNAEIASIAGLHAKLYVFDRIAVVGSANLSKESERRTEAALLTDHPTALSSARLLIERLKSEGDAVDEAFISRISKLPVTKRKRASGGKRKRPEDPKPRSWLVGLKPVQEKDEEQSVVEQGLEEAELHVSDEDSSVSWIRFRGNSRFRREAKEGDVVVCIWTEKTKGKPAAVYRHAPILLRKDAKENNVTWFFVEEYDDAEETALTWKQFEKLYSQIDLPGKLSQWPSRELARHHSDALHDLWLDQK